MDEGGEYFTLIEEEGDIANIPSTNQLALLTQTTLSVDDTARIIEKIQ